MRAFEGVGGETPVWLADGRRVPIAELAGTSPFLVAMSDSGRFAQAVAGAIESHEPSPLIALTLKSGRRIAATLSTRVSSGKGAAALGELAAGDRIALARRLPEPGDFVAWPDARVALLGQMIGDGSFLNQQPMRYTTASEANSAIVREAAEQEFGATVKRYRGRRTWHQLLISGNGNRWHPAGVNAWFRELGIFGQRSHEKRIPRECFRLANPQISLLLRHLWATDGTITIRRAGTRGGHGVSYSTNSPGLATDVAALLLRMGIIARIYRVSQGEYRPAFQVQVSGGEAQRLFLRDVGAFGERIPSARRLEEALAGRRTNTNVDTMPDEFIDRVRARAKMQGATPGVLARARGFEHENAQISLASSRTLLAEYARLLRAPDLEEQATADLFWDVVRSVEPPRRGESFSVRLDGASAWLADGVVIASRSANRRSAAAGC